MVVADKPMVVADKPMVVADKPMVVADKPMVENLPKTCDVCVNIDWLDELYTSRINSVWKTCINMNDRYNKIIYVTQKNVLIKSVETLQIPEFQVQFDNILTIPCKLMIEDKYINCFLYICGNWYAMMRLFGTTINTGHFARTEKNKAFYKLNNAVNIDNTGMIHIMPNTYTEVNKSTVLDTSETNIILFNSNVVENINKSSLVNGEKVFNILQRFRQQKIYANDAKRDLAVDIIDDGLDVAWDIFS
jgi:hypothetical protein